MKYSRLVALLLIPALLWVNSNAHSTASPSTAKQHVLHLNRANTGQHVAATVGQPIRITLQTIGAGNYGTPEVSSSAIRFESAAFAKEQNPGGPKQIYRFHAASPGEAEVKIPHTYSNPTFTLTIRVYPQRKP